MVKTLFKGFTQKEFVPFTKVNGKKTFITPPGVESFQTQGEAGDWASKLVKKNLAKMSREDRKSFGKVTIGVRELD